MNNRIKTFLLALLLAAPLSAPPRLAVAADSNDSPAVLPSDLSEDRLATELMWDAFTRLSPQERPRVVLVLGGGGARGLAHIGVLKVLEQERIPIDAVAGVSVGALIGALYAGGLNADQIDSMAKEIGWDKLTDFSKLSMMKLILSDELMSTKRMESYLNRHIGEKQFSDLRIPFACVATDLRTGERIVFREGPVAIAARASATIPAIFAPVKYRQRSLVDGGLVDNLPTDILNVRKGDVIVAVLPTADVSNEEVDTIFKSLVRSVEIQRDIMINSKRKDADFLIEPNTGNTSLIDLSRSQECIDAGLLATRARVLDLKRLILQRYKASRRDAALFQAREGAVP